MLVVFLVVEVRERLWGETGGGGVEGRGGGGTHVMHGRSRMTIDPPRIPTYFGTDHVGFSPTRETSRACTKQREAKREAVGESHGG